MRIQNNWDRYITWGVIHLSFEEIFQVRFQVHHRNMETNTPASCSLVSRTSVSLCFGHRQSQPVHAETDVFRRAKARVVSDSPVMQHGTIKRPWMRSGIWRADSGVLGSSKAPLRPSVSHSCGMERDVKLSL